MIEQVDFEVASLSEALMQALPEEVNQDCALEALSRVTVGVILCASPEEYQALADRTQKLVRELIAQQLN